MSVTNVHFSTNVLGVFIFMQIPRVLSYFLDLLPVRFNKEQQACTLPEVSVQRCTQRRAACTTWDLARTDGDMCSDGAKPMAVVHILCVHVCAEVCVCT